MEKQIKIINKIMYCLLIFLIAAMIILGDLHMQASMLLACADIDIVTQFEQTNVIDDLTGSVIGGKEFNIKDYPHDDNGKFQIISFIEFCYSYYGDNQNDYGLYIYVYNPQDKAIDTTGKNSIQFTYGDYDNYYKYPLHFLNYSKQLGFEGRFYKFRVNLTNGEKHDILKDLDSNNRIYKVSGFELSCKGKVIDYVCAQKYTYSGFSIGYGSEIAESDTLSCKVDGFDKYLTFDVRSTTWRSESSAKGKNYSNQLNSVYFSVPDEIFDEYGSLQEITAEWYEYKTDWITVTTNMTLYSYMKKNMGRKYFDNGNYISDTSAPYGLFGWDCITPENSSSSRLGRYNYGYSLDHENHESSSYVANPLSAFHYCFFSDKGITDAKIHKKTLTDWIYTYKDNYTVDNFLDCKNGKTIPAELFVDTVDSGRTRGYNRMAISANDSYGLLSYDENHGFWDKVSDFGFWNTLLGKVPSDGSILVNEPILPLRKSEYGNVNKSAYSSMLYVDSEDVDEFDTYIHKSWSKNETPVLFRFAVTDYYRAYGNAISRLGDSSESRKQTLYGAQETVFLDFDIIQLMFRKNNVDTIIPVVASPIDVIGGISPPPIYDKDNSRFLRILKFVLLVLLGLFLLWLLAKTGVLRYIVDGIVWLVKLPFRSIAAIFNRAKK